MVPRVQFASWVAPASAIVDGLLQDGRVDADLRIVSDALELTLRRVRTDGELSHSALEAVVATAARWCFRASWQARALLERDMDARIRIPSGELAVPRISDLSTMPDLGRLIRPLFVEFTPRSELRPFQKVGVAWLLEHPKCILADDMGLGKTLQVLEAVRNLLYRGALQTAVVLCPRTLAANWQSESAKWAPELLVASSTSWRGTPETLWSLAEDRRVHLAIIHYDQLKALPPALVQRTEVQLLVLDEAHRVRRSEAAVTMAVRSIGASSVWALSGTPIERDTEDLATLLSIIAREKYSASVSALGDEVVRSFAEPLLLRRRKVDVLPDLPVVMEQVHYLDLTPDQRAAYASTLANAGAQRENRGALLRVLGDLLSICDLDPATDSSSKIDDVVDRLQRVREEQEKAVVFSYKLNPLDVLEERLAEVDVEYVRIDGQMRADERNAVLSKFRTDPGVVALLASSRVASEGLTLTEANHAFFVNRWWNPSNSDQARDRIVRIGQERPVMIHYYVCKDTIEERLEGILLSKRELVERVVDSLATGATESVDTEDLVELLNPPST